MSIIQGNAKKSTVSGFYPVSIDQSLRFNDDDSAYLSRTPASASNRKTWTWSGWVKRGNFGTGQRIFHASTDSNNRTEFYFRSDDQIEFFSAVGGVHRANIKTDAKFRDPSAWYHLVVKFDAANTSLVIYINGVSQTLTTTTAVVNTDHMVNSTNVHTLGQYNPTGASYLDGYLAEVNFIDGTALDADAFGELKSGVWVAKSPSVTYGTNGFYLDFANSADIGNDVSGEGNDWTPNNFTASDVVLDSPTDNFATLNPLSKTGQTLSNGNLTYSSASGTTSQCAAPTFSVGSSGKWYWEVQITSAPQNQTEECIGITNDIGSPASLQRAYNSAGQYFDGSSWTSYGSAWATNDVIGIAIDVDNSEITFYKNNSNQGTKTFAWNANGNCSLRLGSSAGTTYQVNFGQSGFTYTPPTGYLALSTANLPDPAIDPAQDVEPRDYFETFLYTGNGAGLQVGDVIKKPADTITINNSLLFNDDDAAYLSKTDFGTSTNTAKRTFSTWIKSCDQSYTTYDHIIGAGASSIDGFGFSSDGKLQVLRGGTEVDTGNQSIKDPSRWYHVMLTWDSTAGEWYMYINGVLDATGVASGALSKIGQSGQTNTIMKRSNAAQYIHGYLAETVFLDGYIGSVTDFGEFDANGIWIPKDISTAGLTYGTNGFYLNYADSSDLGKDVSGQGNHWTSNNLATTDQVDDSPTDNFCTLNPLDINTSRVSLADGNLLFDSSDGSSALSTIALDSGKYYAEFELVTASGRECAGVAAIGSDTSGDIHTASGFIILRVGFDVDIRNDGVDSQADLDAAYTPSAGDIIGVALNLDDEEVTFYINNVQKGVAESLTASTAYHFTCGSAYSSGGSADVRANFGQQPFTYTPPTGYLALSENNITVDDQNLESPDLVWIKNRDQADYHQLYDSVRGVQKELRPNTTTASLDAPNGLLDFNTNGFTLGSQNEVNTLGEDYVAWCWKIGGSVVENTNGTGIASQVLANQDTGISILTYTGTGTSGHSVGHGLSQAPDFAVIKRTDSATSSIWYVPVFGSPAYGSLAVNNGSYLRFDEINALSTSTSVKTTISTSTVNFDLAHDYNNKLNYEYIMYCFHSVEGFSKAGSYTGNGSTDGTFVYTGFRPAFLIIKMTSTSGYDWVIVDTERFTYNIVPNTWLAANQTHAEGTMASGYDLDVLSNGFKLRVAGGTNNVNTQTYIYMAFAENPFKYSNAR